MTSEVGKFFGSLLGQPVNTYSSRMNWLRRCVLGRVIISLCLIAVSVTLTLLYGDALASYGVSETVMVNTLIAANIAASLLFAFGAGRNYERLITTGVCRV